MVALTFIPYNVLEEDPKLLMWYDHVLARMSSRTAIDPDLHKDGEIRSWTSMPAS